MQSIHRTPWGTLPDGRQVEAITLTNSGFQATFLSLGAILQSWKWNTTDHATGRPLDVVLGCATLEEYLKDTSYHGAVVGRFGNRIRNGKFTLEGKSYALDTNNGPNHLHGGCHGFDKALWNVEVDESLPAVRFTHESPEGDQGYPGKLHIEVLCSLGSDGRIRYTYRARSEATTILNPTAHPYFNLAGQSSGNFENDHLLQIFATHYLPKDDTGIPLGNIAPVAQSAYDFRQPRCPREPLGHEELTRQNGYDHSWVIDGPAGTLRCAARAIHSPSARALEVWTTEPAVHFYNGHYNDHSPALMKDSARTAASRSGFALETQHFPDSPNQPDFPSVVLRPGESFYSETEYRPIEKFA